MKTRISFLSAALMLACGCAATPAPRSNDETGLVRSVTVIEERGGRVSWSPDGAWIAFDQRGDDGFYDVYIMRPDQTDRRCLTCDREGTLPQKHNGSPEFHPSGDYIVFTSEKPVHKGRSRFAIPGMGVFNDIWLMSVDGSNFWKLVNIPNNSHHGTVHPHFSKDGDRMAWSMMVEKLKNILSPKRAFGAWQLKSADFKMTPEEGPALSNIRELQGDVPAFYENHGFSRDGARILFSSSFEARWPLDNNLYTIELGTGAITNLSGAGYPDRSYDEHAQFSPDGTQIVWGTNRGNRNKGMDYWIMNADGSEQQRLTFFNHPTIESGLPKRETYYTCDFSFHPDGKKLAAWIITDLGKQRGITAIIELN